MSKPTNTPLERRDFLKWCAVAGGAFALAPCPVGAGEAGNTKPNIVVMMSDDHSWCDVGFNANPDVRTPNLDRLASRGMRLDHCYTTSAVCAPSRFQFHSGRYPNETQFYGNNPKLVRRMQFETTPSVLAALGYRCVHIGKYHLEPITNYPFEYIYERMESYGKDYGRRAAEFIRDEMRQESRPVYLLVPFREPHLDWGKADKSVYDPAKLTVPPYMPDTPNSREALASYYTRISDLDRKIGNVLDALDASGKAESTLVIWTSEQGMQVPRSKWTACDLGLRTAFVARWPGKIKPGSRTDAMVQYVDALPTIAEAAGGKAPEGIDGRSFLPILLGSKSDHRDFVYGASGWRTFYSVRNHEHKYIWYSGHPAAFSYGFTDVGKHTKDHCFEQQWQAAAEAGDPTAQWIVNWIESPPLEELYDVRKDPYELDNLSEKGELAGVKADLRECLRAWLVEQRDHKLKLFDSAFPNVAK